MLLNNLSPNLLPGYDTATATLLTSYDALSVQSYDAIPGTELIFIVTVWTFVNTDICEWTLDKYMCNIWQATSILVMCSGTEKNLSSD